MLEALYALASMSRTSTHTKLNKTLLGLMTPSIPIIDADDTTVFFNTALNDSQKNAVLFSLRSPEVSLIHEPPGNDYKLIASNAYNLHSDFFL